MSNNLLHLILNSKQIRNLESFRLLALNDLFETETQFKQVKQLKQRGTVAITDLELELMQVIIDKVKAV